MSIRRGFLFVWIFIDMDDFEEKYGLVLKYMVPSAHKCIDKVEVDGFVPGSESLGSNEPKDDFERKMNDKFNEYITPRLKVTLHTCCEYLSGVNSIVLKGDIFGKLTEIHSTFFPDMKLNANIRYIDVIQPNS